MKRGLCAIGLGVLAAALSGCAAVRPPAEAPAGNYQAEQLVGASDNALLRAFGPPAQRRREPPAEVWQYRVPECVVDFYLYQLQPVGLSVVHLEARSPVSGRLPVDSCLRRL